jgi:Flp pilus assembly protein TadG
VAGFFVKGEGMHKQRAQAVVEFAFVAPFLIVVALGILGFGRVFYTNIDLINLARYGARHAIALPASTSCPTAEAQVQSQVQSAFQAEHPGQPNPTIVLTCLADRRTVTLTYSFDTLMPVITLPFYGTLNFLGPVELSTLATLPLPNS